MVVVGSCPAKGRCAGGRATSEFELVAELEFGEGGKLELGSEFEFDEPIKLGLEMNSYSDTHSSQPRGGKLELE